MSVITSAITITQPITSDIRPIIMPSFNMANHIYSGFCTGEGKKICYNSMCSFCSVLKDKLKSIISKKEEERFFLPAPKKLSKSLTSHKSAFAKEMLEFIHGEDTRGHFIWVASFTEPKQTHYLFHALDGKFWSVCLENEEASIEYSVTKRKTDIEMCFSQVVAFSHKPELTISCGKDIVSRYFCLSCYNVCDSKTCPMCRKEAELNKYYCGDCLQEYVDWHYGHYLHRYYTFNGVDEQINEAGDIISLPVFVSREIDDEGRIKYYFPKASIYTSIDGKEQLQSRDYRWRHSRPLDE